MNKTTLKYRPNGYIDWSKISEEDSKAYILSEMKKHNSLKEFTKGCPALARTMQVKGWARELQLERGWNPKIMWEKMGKKEGVRLMKETALKYNSLTSFAQEQSSMVAKARQWGAYKEVTSCIPRVFHEKTKLMSMDYHERLCYCKEIAKKCQNRTVFQRNYRLAHKTLKEFGDNIYEEVTKEIFGKKKKYSYPSKDRNGFLKLCKKIDPSEPYLIKNINQMVGYYVTRMSSGESDSFFNNIDMKFFDSDYLENVWNVPLAELWTWNWQEKGRGLYGFAGLLRLAASDGLDVPIRSKDTKTKLPMLQNIVESTCSLVPETIGELFAKEGSLQRNFTSLISAIRIVAHKKLSQVNLWNLLDTIDSCETETGKAKKIQKKILKSNIEKLIKDGKLPKNFNEFENAMLVAYKRHRGSEDTLIEHRTIDWYFFETYQDLWHDIDRGDAKTRHQLSHHYNTLPRNKPCSLTLELFRKITGRRKQMFDKMTKDRVLPDSFFNKEQEEYSFDDNKWSFDSATMNFARISNKSIRKAVKVMSKKLLKVNKPSTLTSHITHARYLDEFLSASKIPSLAKFTTNHKNDFYNYLIKLEENGEHSKAHGLLRLTRKLYATLNTAEERKGIIAPDLNFPKTEYSVSKKPKDYNYPILTHSEMQEILDYLVKVRKMAPSRRITRTAIILQLILSRRPSETIGLETDCIVFLGDSGEWLLKYRTSKQNAIKKVSVSILCGYRQDPFALRMRDLVPELVQEVKDLTRMLRGLAPKEIRSKLFIRHGYKVSKANPVMVETYNQIRTEWGTIKEQLGINPRITLHKSRHTAATLLLRTGSNYAQIGEALGDTANTIKNNYSATISKLETMSLARGHLVGDIESDVKKIVDTKYSSPRPISDTEAMNSNTLHKVCGGNCGTSQEKMHACETYLMTKGGSGCKGCPSFFPSPINLPYWIMEQRSDYGNMQKAKGTPLHKRHRLNYLRTENLVKTLKEMSNG